MAGTQSVRKPNIALSFQELFTAVVRLRFNRQSVPNADAFRSHMREAYGLAAQDAAAKGYSPEAVSRAGCAVISFLDESVINSRNFIFANWSLSPMRLELFPDSNDEFFFIAIQELLASPDSPEAADVLEVFYLCLLLGYRGKHMSVGGNGLGGIIESIRSKIASVRGENAPLSPAWTVPGEPIAMPPPDPVRRICLGLSVVALALALITFATCKFLLASGAAQIHSAVVQSR